MVGVRIIRRRDFFVFLARSTKRGLRGVTPDKKGGRKHGRTAAAERGRDMAGRGWGRSKFNTRMGSEQSVAPTAFYIRTALSLLLT